MHRNDPQEIWQSQQTEEVNLSPAYFRLRASHERAKNLSVAVANDLAYACILIFFGYVFVVTPVAAFRVFLALLAVGSSYFIYRRHLELWPGPLSSNASPDSGLAAYRRELQRRADDLRKVWRILAPVIALAVVFPFFAIPRLLKTGSSDSATFMNALPFFLLLAAWIVSFSVIRSRSLKKIQEELAALGEAH